MRTLLFFLLMIVSSCEKESDFQIVDGDVYIYEYSRKNYGQAIVGFIITNDSFVVQDISFKIYFSDDKLKKVLKYNENKRLRSYVKKEDGNIEIEGLLVLCCSSENFKKEKRDSDEFYKILSDDFLNIENKERLRILYELSK